jgi:putative flavoprotein involved in K+ transport
MDALRPTENRAERIETVVIGGGQAGLSVGYELKQRRRPFVILDANERTGDSWRRRWDSLLLFTPARINGLAGMRVPGSGDAFMTKDQMADYLEAYAERMDLPIRRGVRADGLTREGDRLVVTAGGRRFEAENVVVAMANYQVPHVPAFADALAPGITQIHSHDYRNPSQLQDGAVLVVGVGNSGADIGLEIARSHPTWMAGEESAHVPFRIETFVARKILLRIVRFVGHHVLTVRTPMGRKFRPKFLTEAAPLVRVKPKDLVGAGIERVPRVAGVKDGRPQLEDGRVLEVSNVVWCTGYRPGFSWIGLPVLGEHDEPMHERGVVASEPGLYFVGLRFLYSATSDTITGVGRDAARVAKHIAARTSKGNTTALGRSPAGRPVGSALG